MAFPSQGATITWNGVTLQEVTEIAVTGAGVDLVDTTGRLSARVKQFEPGDVDLGTVTATALYGNLTTASLGQKAGISISGGGVSYSGQAIFASLDMAVSVGEVSRISYSFRMCG